MEAPVVNVRNVARVILVGGLLGILLIGLLWAFNPAEEGGVRFAGDPSPADGETEEAGEEDGAEDEEEADPDPDPDATAQPSPEPTETGPPAEELIAAAPDPAETSVQVLDAGGGASRTQAAAEALEELGYQVVNTTSARIDVTATTVWFSEGSEEAALALRARDERVVEVGENEAFSPGVDLHLLVGPDWAS